MTLEKAIEILDDLKIEPWFEHFSPNDRERACKLGIEALKLLQHLKHHPEDGKKLGFITLLPGETMNFNLKVIQKKEGK